MVGSPEQAADHRPAGGLLSRRDVLRRAAGLAIALPTPASLLEGCSDGGEPQGRVLTLGAITPSTTVDPVIGFDGSGIALFQQVNEYLIWLEPDLTSTPQMTSRRYL